MFQKRGLRLIGRIISIPFIILAWLIDGEVPAH